MVIIVYRVDESDELKVSKKTGQDFHTITKIRQNIINIYKAVMPAVLLKYWKVFDCRAPRHTPFSTFLGQCIANHRHVEGMS